MGNKLVNDHLKYRLTNQLVKNIPCNAVTFQRKELQKQYELNLLQNYEAESKDYLTLTCSWK